MEVQINIFLQYRGSLTPTGPTPFVYAFDTRSTLPVVLLAYLWLADPFKNS